MAKTCIICCDDIDKNDIVEYLDHNNIWQKTDFCINCINYELDNLWKRYISNLKEVDCEASLKRLITKESRIYFAFPELNDGKDILEFRYKNEKFSGKIRGIPTDNIINKLKHMLESLLPILDGTQEILNEYEYDYMDKLNKILVEFNL